MSKTEQYSNEALLAAQCLILSSIETPAQIARGLRAAWGVPMDAKEVKRLIALAKANGVSNADLDTAIKDGALACRTGSLKAHK